MALEGLVQAFLRRDAAAHARSPEEERDLLRAILASTSEGVYSTDLEGRIVSFNASAERITRRRAEDVVGRGYVEALGLVDPSEGSRSEGELPLECCIRTKQPVYLPLAYVTRPDGRRVPVALSTSPILGPLGGPAWCVAVFRDIERDLEIEEMKVNLISLVSHELRTPLGHIRGFTSTLLQEDVEWDQPMRTEFLRDIEREVGRLDRLITDLLDMSRMQAGALVSAERCPSAPIELVTAGLEPVRGLLRGRDVAVDVPPDLPAIEVDAPALSRVISNLVENAAKYSPAGSAVTIRARRRADRLTIAVEDRGPGIPSAEHERVFEKFVRVAHPGLPPVPGAGLGLAICRGIVAAHGGTVRAEDREGGGSRLVVSLPLQARTAGG